ncbi:MAG: hypothetical protein KDD00_16095 [Ignavibacteriae bacterium]|nr:hypothetical protein [Ignavibacteriota bacterium]
MESTLLIRILRSFTKNEIIRFDEFLRSPFYNKKPNAVKFFETLKKHAPDYKAEQVGKENIWKELYPGKKYNWGVLKNLIFDLTKLSEKFIEVIQYEDNSTEKNFLYLDALSKRKIHNKFFSEYNLQLKNIEKNKFYHDYYSDIQKLLLKKINHCSVYTNYQTELDEEINAVSDSFMYDSIVKLSGFFKNIAIYSTGYNKSGNKSITEHFFGIADKNNFITGSNIKNERDYRILLVYYYQYLAFAYPENRENYFNFKKHLHENSGLFSTGEKSNLYIHLGDALNLRPSKKGDNKVLEFLEHYKKQIDENVFTDPDGGINIYSYSNIIKMASRLSDHKLIKFVKDNFFDLLLPEFKENMNLFTEAFYNYSKGNWEKALENALRIKPDHFIFKYDLRDLTGMLYYELNDYESFTYLMDSHKHFLKKNKNVSEKYKNWYDIFISNIYRLLKIKLNFDEYELIRFEKVVEEGISGGTSYFTAKIKELKKLHKIK